MSETIALEKTEEKKTYELRSLQSKDTFAMFKILKKINFKELKTVFEKDNVKELMISQSNDAQLIESVGMSLMLDVIGIIIEHLDETETDIYNFLASLSGLTVKEISELQMNVFIEMIIDVTKKKEFKDFFKVVSKLFK